MIRDITVLNEEQVLKKFKNFNHLVINKLNIQFIYFFTKTVY